MLRAFHNLKHDFLTVVCQKNACFFVAQDQNSLHYIFGTVESRGRGFSLIMEAVIPNESQFCVVEPQKKIYNGQQQHVCFYKPSVSGRSS